MVCLTMYVHIRPIMRVTLVSCCLELKELVYRLRMLAVLMYYFCSYGFILTTQSKNQIRARSLFYDAPCLKSLINEKEWPSEPVSGGMSTHRSHFLLSNGRVIRSTAPKLKIIRRIKWVTYFFYFQWVTIVLNGSTQLCNTSNSLWQWYGHPCLVLP